jgi:cytoskeletal protein RodZ
MIHRSLIASILIHCAALVFISNLFYLKQKEIKTTALPIRAEIRYQESVPSSSAKTHNSSRSTERPTDLRTVNETAVQPLNPTETTPEKTQQPTPAPLGPISQAQRFSFAGLTDTASEDMAAGPFGGSVRGRRGFNPTASERQSDAASSQQPMRAHETQMQIAQRRTLFEQTLRQRADALRAQHATYTCVARVDALAVVASLECSPPDVAVQEMRYFSNATRFTSQPFEVDRCYVYGPGDWPQCSTPANR